MRRFWVALLGALAMPFALAEAQASVWLSAGVGPASFMNSGGAALRGAANATYRRAALIHRRTNAFDSIDGYLSTDERAFLAGVRLGGAHFYVIPALGIGNTQWQDNSLCDFSFCGPAVTEQRRGKSRALAFDLGLHASKWVVGFAVNLSATMGPANGQLYTLAFSPELGWFGR